MNSKLTTENTRITALYERLSRADELAGDSNSIINQKRLFHIFSSQNINKPCADRVSYQHRACIVSHIK